MEISAGVQALVNRMESNPEEFFDPKENSEWTFIYKETFRDVMTEPEKAAIHTALRSVRRKEFESRVMKQILRADAEDYSAIPKGYNSANKLLSTEKFWK